MTRRQQLALLAAALLSFIGVLTETSMNVTFPTLVRQLQVPLTTVSWLATGYLLMVTLVMGTTAYLMKRWPTRRLFLVAWGVDLLGTLLCAVATDFPLLMAGRLLQAVATGLAIPLLFALIFSLVPRTRLGVYTGLAEMLISLAPALGPTYGGTMTALASWRYIFIGVLPVLVIAGWLGLAFITVQPARGASGFDAWGLSLLAILFTAIVWGLTEAGRLGFGAAAVWLALVLGALALVGLLAHIRHGRWQLLDWRILRRPGLAYRLITYFLLQLINIGSSYVIPLLVENGLGKSALVAGLVLFPGAMLGALIAPLAGRWYDQIGLPRIIVVSCALVMLGAGLLAISSGATTLWLIAVSFLVLRLGFNSGFGNSMSAASQLVPVTNRADQNSLFNMLQQYAGSLGTGGLAAVMATVTRAGGSTALGSRWSFLVLLALAVLAELAAVAGNRQVSRETKNRANA